MKWELIVFRLKVLPVMLTLVFAWLASRGLTAKKVLMELLDSIKQAMAVVNHL